MTGVVQADRYACPSCDYIWFRPDVGVPVPTCPDHGVRLVRAPVKTPN